MEDYEIHNIDFDNCVKLITHIGRNGHDKLEEHHKYYGEVLLHVYASEEVVNPLNDLLDKHSDSILVDIYCRAIELMWKYGDDFVSNMVEVTLFERLSDSNKVWNRIGK